jgi:hypothetical protein
MEDSYRQPLILEPGHCQEGKYDFRKRVREAASTYTLEILEIR